MKTQMKEYRYTCENSSGPLLKFKLKKYLKILIKPRLQNLKRVEHVIPIEQWKERFRRDGQRPEFIIERAQHQPPAQGVTTVEG